LRVTARILKGGIYPYAAAEMPDELRKQFPNKDEIRQQIDPAEFTPEALASLEGKPVITDAHEWQEASGSPDAAKLRVGSIAGKPTKDGDGVVCDFLVTHPRAIADIQSGKLIEVSAGYDSTLEQPKDPVDYDAIQRDLRFNHVLLLPEGRGRCGPEVRILNQGEPMPIEMRIGNSSFKFSSDADLAEATRFGNAMSGAATKAMWAQVDDAGNGHKSKKSGEFKDMDGEWHTRMERDTAESIAEFGEHEKTRNATRDEQTALIADLKAKLAKAEEDLKNLGSEEYAEGQAKESAELNADSEKIMSGEKKEDQETLKKALGNCKTRNEKRRAIVTHVMNSRGVDASKFSDAEVAASFKVLATTAKPARPTAQLPTPSARVQNAKDGNGGDPAAAPSWRTK
jgi:hypothetical protein